MQRSALVLSAALLLRFGGLAGHCQTPGAPFQELARHFDYDRNLAFEERESGAKHSVGVTVHDISYVSPIGGRVPAYLVVPNGTGPFAAILFGHWMMKGSPFRNRNEFLDEAMLLARSGAVSLLIDAPYVRPGFVEDRDLLGSAEQGSRVERQQIIDLRRGLDLLLARLNIDPSRIAYVGHSFDAHAGAILAGVEKRIHSFVLMAGSYADEENTLNSDNPEVIKIRKQLGQEKLRQYFRQYAWDDPIHYLPHSSPAAVFLQFASKDQTEKRARQYYNAFAQPKKMEIYDAEHALNAAARRDRVSWLVRRLGLRPVEESALKRIPKLK